MENTDDYFAIRNRNLINTVTITLFTYIWGGYTGIHIYVI